MIVRLSPMRSPVARNRSLAVTLICTLALLYTYRHSYDPVQQLYSTAENSTLGFGAIYVLTEDASTWRVQGLRSATTLVGLKLTAPVQQRPTDDQLLSHLKAATPKNVNAVRAVLNYVSLFEEFLRSGLETALFVEDDVDFGLPIKSQMRAISQAILAHDYPGEASRALDDHNVLLSAHMDHPYGGSNWDVLWIGHYGIELNLNSDTRYYDDLHTLPWDHLTSPFNDYYQWALKEDATAEQKRQQIIYSVAPMATYAFALTRDAAKKVIDRVKEDRVQEFDYNLHRMCKGLELLCLAPVPQVMQHHRVDGQTSLNDQGYVDDANQDLKWWRNRHKFTHNIEWSARCNAGRVGEKVGDKWQCLPGKYDRRF